MPHQQGPNVHPRRKGQGSEVRDYRRRREQLMCWIINNFDRFLALVAILLALFGIVIAAIAMWDVRRLFKELESRDKNTEHRVRQAVLKELLTATASFGTFSRAAQFIDFYPGQPDRATAIAMLMAFRGSATNSSRCKEGRACRIAEDDQESVGKGSGRVGAGHHLVQDR